MSATSRNFDLSTMADCVWEVTMIAQATELVMVWDGQRHLSNVANGEGATFRKGDDGWFETQELL